MREPIDVFREQINMFREQINVFREQIDVFREQIDVFREQIDVFREQINVFREQIDVFREQINVFREQIDVFGEEIECNREAPDRMFRAVSCTKPTLTATRGCFAEVAEGLGGEGAEDHGRAPRVNPERSRGIPPPSGAEGLFQQGIPR
ncbi:MAG TPA: hypothetical protein VNI54_14045 [Thermoanaerobaculia bacterium]|nr:hypothetical protein [Thermoanaerobaculia bacterium]